MAQSTMGLAFIDWYYSQSPAWADWITDKPILITIGQGMLYPVVLLAKISLKPNQAILFGTLIMGLFGFAAYRWRQKKALASTQ